jgi:hypothetical protein
LRKMISGSNKNSSLNEFMLNCHQRIFWLSRIYRGTIPDFGGRACVCTLYPQNLDILTEKPEDLIFEQGSIINLPSIIIGVFDCANEQGDQFKSRITA